MAEWDIRNKLETIDGMPVYYGGDLCDSHESDWEDPCDLAYAEYVDLRMRSMCPGNGTESF